MTRRASSVHLAQRTVLKGGNIFRKLQKVKWSRQRCGDGLVGHVTENNKTKSFIVPSLIKKKKSN